ncbi:MFS general substrate transporter, partial [Gymnopus androsaceus JB14]
NNQIVPSGIGIFLYAFDSTLIPASYAVIGSDFNQLEHTGWIATSYMLMLASIQPLYGKLSDIFGHKSCLLFAYSVYGFGCLGCGLSSNLVQLVAARALSGVGGAGLTTLISVLVADVVPLRSLGAWNGALNVIFVLGQTAGSPLGGYLADGPGWRWSFLFQLPLLVLGCLSGLVMLKPPEAWEESTLAKLKRIDFMGAFSLIVAVVALLVGLDRGGNIAWLDTTTLAVLITSAVAFTAFWTIELKFASEPFAPCHILIHEGLIAPYLCDFFSISADSCLIFFLPLFFQVVETQTAAQAGTLLVPAAISATIGTLAGGWSVQRSGKFWWLIVCGYSTQALGTCLVAFAVYAKGITYSIASFGCGFGITATVVAIVGNAGKGAQAVATSVSFLFRSTGAVVGILIGGTIIQISLRSLLHNRLEATEADVDEIVNGVRASLSYIYTLPVSLQTKVRLTYCEAVFYACIFATVFALGSLLSAFRITEKSISHHSTEGTEQ